MVLGISAILIVLDHFRVQRCFVSIMRLKIIGLYLSINQNIRFGLVLLTCHHMEEGKVPSSMAGSQDALLPTLIGSQENQTTPVTMKIMYTLLLVVENGMTALLKINGAAAVSTLQL